MSQDSNFGYSTNAISVYAGTLLMTASFSSARTFDLEQASTLLVSAGQTVMLSGGGNSGVGGVTVGGAGDTGTLTLSGVLQGEGVTLSGGTLILSGTNTYVGGTTVTAGTLEVGADANLGATGSGNGLTLSGGLFESTATFASARRSTLGGGAIGPAGGDDADTVRRPERRRGIDVERGGDAGAHGDEHVHGRRDRLQRDALT